MKYNPNKYFNLYVTQNLIYYPILKPTDKKEIDTSSLFLLASSDDEDFFLEKLFLFYNEFYCESIDTVIIGFNKNQIEIKGGTIKKLKRKTLELQDLFK